MTVARVSRINVTPVKSLRLHHPDAVELGPDGARDDRRFLLVDDGLRLYNGKRDTTLVRATASWDVGTRVLGVRLPGGELVEGEAVPTREVVVHVYGRDVSGHVVTGPWADALSDLVGRSLTLVERTNGAWATDSRPATMISRASVGLIEYPLFPDVPRLLGWEQMVTLADRALYRAKSAGRDTWAAFRPCDGAHPPAGLTDLEGDPSWLVKAGLVELFGPDEPVSVTPR